MIKVQAEQVRHTSRTAHSWEGSFWLIFPFGKPHPEEDFQPFTSTTWTTQPELMHSQEKSMDFWPYPKCHWAWLRRIRALWSCIAWNGQMHRRDHLSIVQEEDMLGKTSLKIFWDVMMGIWDFLLGWNLHSTND
jgi:hypothetical protein